MIDLATIIRNRAYNRLSVGDFEVLADLPFEDAQASLTMYFQSDVGREDLRNSSHAGRPVDEVVGDLLKELFPSG